LRIALPVAPHDQDLRHRGQPYQLTRSGTSEFAASVLYRIEDLDALTMQGCSPSSVRQKRVHHSSRTFTKILPCAPSSACRPSMFSRYATQSGPGMCDGPGSDGNRNQSRETGPPTTDRSGASGLRTYRSELLKYSATLRPAA